MRTTSFRHPGWSRPGRCWQAPGMVLEVALIDVVPGQEAEFAAAYRSVVPELAGTPGCRSVRMTHGIETPSRFVLLVEWDSMAAHEDNFRATDRFVRWRATIGPFFANPPRVEHFLDVPTD
jgi:heme-degrading monooxygenase HmoA